MNNNDKNFIVRKIRAEYVEKGQSDLDELKRLDTLVKRPAKVFGFVFGSIAALVMGAGMSLVMTDIAQTVGIANPMVLGIVIGVVGMAMAAINYPIYKNILEKRRKKFAEKILELSAKISEE